MRIFALFAAAAALSLSGCDTEKSGDCTTVCTELFEDCDAGCDDDEDCSLTCEGERDVCVTGCDEGADDDM